MVKKRPKSRPVRVSAASSTPRESSASESIEDVMLTVTNSTHSVLPIMKVCRLCETKDGPFLNIFEADKVTAKRINEVLPFTVADNDDLPNIICFRCSAKLEELYEFILKCIKTQENLRLTVGNKTPLITKSRFRVQWENQLGKKNISNDDICNALIKKAMEGIKDAPQKPLSVKEDSPSSALNKRNKLNAESLVIKKTGIEPPSIADDTSHHSDEDDAYDDVKLKHVKLAIDKCDKKLPVTRSMRSNKQENEVDISAEPTDVTNSFKQQPSRKSQAKTEMAVTEKSDNIKTKTNLNASQNKDQNVASVNNKGKCNVVETAEKSNDPPKAPEPPPINIMDHVSTIKVNSVGTLFLCKLCNRNFLKKELVLTHGCAKNNVPKDKFLHNLPPPRETPKPSTVKYIKMDKDFKKPVIPEKPVEKTTPPQAVKPNIPAQPDVKPKPKIGPASRVKNQTVEASNTQAQSSVITPILHMPIAPKPPQETRIIPEVKFPNIPSLNSRYKLLPGPNNTFTLIEESTPPPLSNLCGPSSKSKKRKNVTGDGTNQLPVINKEIRQEVIELDDAPLPPPVIQQPYPVGLFQTAHHSGGFAPTMPKTPTFTTPAMKKQSYTIVQTGNPSKLLISTKPQVPTEEPLRKKSKKNKEHGESNMGLFNPPEEDSSTSKDAGFFTFINVDPLVQPSYVLPTNNIIQESQISTSTPVSKGIVEKEKDKYSCNMCEETFSREKKLLSHIQSHFNQMDEEDQLRNEKIVGPKKKTRK